MPKCTLCNYEGEFDPYGLTKRPNAKCKGCGSLERHRLMKMFVDKHSSSIRGRIIHFAAEPNLRLLFSKLAASYQPADYKPTRPDEIKLNLESLELETGSVEVFILNHVLEHTNDQVALQEMHRCLSKNGIVIASVPIVWSWNTTFEDVSIVTDEDRTKYYGHPDHKRTYGTDFTTLLERSGFKVVDKFVPFGRELVAYGLNPGDAIWLAEKSDHVEILKHKTELDRRRFARSVKCYKNKIGSYIDRAPQLRQDALSTTKVYASRQTLLSELVPLNIPTFVEVGVEYGIFSKDVARIVRPASLHLIDLDLSRVVLSDLERISSETKIFLHEGMSEEMLTEFDDESLDVIYVDADHRYEGVSADIRVSVPKVKKGGLIIFNDYAAWSPESMYFCGVSRAVNELLNETGWKVMGISLQGSGYYDIAIQAG